MKEELPKKYETPDWLWVYGNIGLTEEHIKRLNNAINLLESLNEHTDARYLKEIKDKLLADAPMQEKKATPRKEYCNEEIGVSEPVSKTFPRVNEFEDGSSYRR